jgi:hypothetical protein
VKQKEKQEETKNYSNERIFEIAFQTASDIKAQEEIRAGYERLSPQNISEVETKEKNIAACTFEIQRLKSFLESIPHTNSESPKALTKRLLFEGVEHHDIAGILHESYSLSPYRIGKLLPASDKPIKDSSIGKRGRRLIEKYKNSCNSRLLEK